MKYILCTLLLVLSASLSGFSQGIQFFEGTFEAAQQKAGAENKLIFIDFYADWCMPCKMMAKQVFTDSIVSDYFNLKFINLQINVEKEENQKLVKQYKVTSMPTLAFFRPDGKAVLLSVGAREKDDFLKMARTATGEEMSFEKRYAQCKSSGKDIELIRYTLKEAPDFVGGLDGIEKQKWISRINKLYKDYINEQMKSDTALINLQDYKISLRFHEIIKDDPLLEFINKHIDAYRAKLGNPPAAWLIEYNNKIAEDLAKAGNQEYLKYLERINGDMKVAYSIAPKGEISIYERQKSYCDGLYILYHDKNADKYIEHINRYLTSLGAEATALDYAQAAQNMYYAIQGKITPEQNQAAIQWNIKALQYKNTPLIDRINILTMMGDSYKALKDYKKAEEAYNQAYLESLQVEGEMTSMQIQMLVKQKLTALELLK